MNKRYLKTLSITVIVITCFSIVPLGRTQNAEQKYASFLLLNSTEGDLTYELNVTIPQDLYQYYTTQSHATYSSADFAKFVTPYALKPIADKLWQLYNNTEDFANGVLMLVHQIAYKEIIPGKYPIETLVDGYGDCDLFVYVAASILQAGGVPVVLIYYKAQEHMELGIDLGSAPVKARVQVFSVNVQGVSYYIAECTGTQWRDGWRVGETPTQYQNISSRIIIPNYLQSPIGQVSASLRELDPSGITLHVSSSLMLENNNVTIGGQILPETADQNVTLKALINGADWETIGTVETNADGHFVYNWAPPTGGSIEIQASWIGNRQYNGATSSYMSILVLPIAIVVLILAAIAVLVVFFIVLAKVSRRKPCQSKPVLPRETAINPSTDSPGSESTTET